MIPEAVDRSGQIFKVIRVYDGDTIKAVGHDIEIKVRLVGIDAPETSKGKRKPGQPFGRKAEKHLAALILNKVVDIKSSHPPALSRMAKTRRFPKLLVGQLLWLPYHIDQKIPV